jgi:hypothetical protein
MSAAVVGADLTVTPDLDLFVDLDKLRKYLVFSAEVLRETVCRSSGQNDAF